jgi:orotidine-5'-phosphate decarboxylase
MVTRPNRILPETIIWSADVEWEVLKEVIDQRLLPVGTVIKLDRLFFEKYGKEIITYCQDAGYPVFVDAKIIEIPDKVIKIAETFLVYKPWMLNVMAGACSTGLIECDNPKDIDALKRFADACAAVGTKSCAVTVLTSKSPELCEHEFNTGQLDQVLFYVNLMCQAGFTDIVCSPLEAEGIRKIEKYDGLCINTPGVRMPGSSKDDQARVATPLEALQNGANRLVIGRDLTRGDGGPLDNIGKNYRAITQSLLPYYM